jgi:hypothetical protein
VLFAPDSYNYYGGFARRWTRSGDLFAFGKAANKVWKVLAADCDNQ